MRMKMIKEGKEDSRMTHVNIDLENWMSDLPSPLKQFPIVCMAIPGTHDSGSCTISRTSPIAPDSGTLVRKLGKVFGPIVQCFVYNWVVTQHSTITEQLINGVRYLDLRVATKRNSTSLYFVHGLYGSEISSLLQEVKTFLKTHQGEVVILDFQHFYNFSTESHTKLISLLNSIFSEMICPFIPNVMDISLSWLRNKGYQVIVIYRDSIGRGLWPARWWPTPWPDTTSPQKMLSFLSEKLRYRSINSGFVSQCVLTPNLKFVLLNPLSTLEKKCGKPCHHVILPWIEQQCPGPGGINVIIADFIHSEKFPFTEKVIHLNYKLLRSGENTQNIVNKK